MRATYPGGLGLCGVILGLTLSYGSTSCMPEAGAHDPKPRIHCSHPRTGGRAQMHTPPPSIKTFWVYAPCVVLCMGSVGHPWCTWVCRSHLYAGQ